MSVSSILGKIYYVRPVITKLESMPEHPKIISCLIFFCPKSDVIGPKLGTNVQDVKFSDQCHQHCLYCYDSSSCCTHFVMCAIYIQSLYRIFCIPKQALLYIIFLQWYNHCMICKVSFIQYNWIPSLDNHWFRLIHFGRVMHIWVGNLIIIGSDNGLSPERR